MMTEREYQAFEALRKAGEEFVRRADIGRLKPLDLSDLYGELKAALALVAALMEDGK